MKRLFFVIAVLSVALSSCQFFGPQKQSQNATEKSADGTFIKKKHFNNDNHSPVEWEISMKYSEDGSSAFRHGVSKRYTKSGKLAEEIFYVNNKKEGTRLTYHSTGKVYKEQPYKNGRLNGMCKRYDREGRLAAEYPYKNGLVGVGLKEYTNLGKERPYPVLNIKKTDKIRTNNTYILGFSLSGEGVKRIKSVEYFEGELLEGKYLHKNLSPAKRISVQKGEIVLKVSKGKAINKTLNVVAVCKTVDGGLKLVLQKKVKVDIRGI